MPKEKYYLYREDGTEDIKVIKYKDNVNEVYSLTGAHFSDEKKIMTDSDLKRFKGAHGLLYEQELGLQATIFVFRGGTWKYITVVKQTSGQHHNIYLMT
ncbi:putative phi ETA-like protein [Staphylococcus aureus]|nr:putative phi ETA-like protein [Staphylococcus aureus]